MNNLHAPAPLKAHFLNPEDEKNARYKQRTHESAKELRNHTINWYSQAGINWGVMKRGTKKTKDAALSLFDRLNLVEALKNNTHFDPEVGKKLLHALASVTFSSKMSSTALTQTPLLKTSALSPNAVRISPQFASHVTKDIQTHLAMAPIFAQQILNTNPTNLAINVIELKTKFHAGLLSKNTATLELEDAFLRSHGIRDGKPTLDKVNQLAANFNGPVKSKLFFKNTSIPVFNENAQSPAAGAQNKLADFGRSMQDWIENRTQETESVIASLTRDNPALQPIPAQHHRMT